MKSFILVISVLFSFSVNATGTCTAGDRSCENRKSNASGVNAKGFNCTDCEAYDLSGDVETIAVNPRYNAGKESTTHKPSSGKDANGAQ